MGIQLPQTANLSTEWYKIYLKSYQFQCKTPTLNSCVNITTFPHCDIYKHLGDAMQRQSHSSRLADRRQHLTTNDIQLFTATDCTLKTLWWIYMLSSRWWSAASIFDSVTLKMEAAVSLRKLLNYTELQIITQNHHCYGSRKNQPSSGCKFRDRLPVSNKLKKNITEKDSGSRITKCPH